MKTWKLDENFSVDVHDLFCLILSLYAKVMAILLNTSKLGFQCAECGLKLKWGRAMSCCLS
jgi:hypothetical protein